MIDAMKSALETLAKLPADAWISPEAGIRNYEAMSILRQAIEQAEQWNPSDMAHRPNGLTIDDDDIQEYKKPWVGLTDDEISNCWINFVVSGTFTKKNVYEAIEAKLKEKNK
jgi:hypothetical protein